MTYVITYQPDDAPAPVNWDTAPLQQFEALVETLEAHGGDVTGELTSLLFALDEEVV